MVPLIVLIFVMGLYPKPFIDTMDPAVKKLVSQIRPASMTAQNAAAAMPAVPAVQVNVQQPEGNSGTAAPVEPHGAAAPAAANPHEAK